MTCVSFATTWNSNLSVHIVLTESDDEFLLVECIRMWSFVDVVILTLSCACYDRLVFCNVDDSLAGSVLV